MILDSSLIFDDKAAVTVTRPSTNVIDIAMARDIGIGERDLDLLIQVTQTFVAPGGTTIQAQWQGSTDNVTFNTIVESRAVLYTLLTAGKRFLAMGIPRQSPDSDEIQSSMYRYFRVNYVVTGGPATAGAVSATIVLERSDIVPYPKNFAISS